LRSATDQIIDGVTLKAFGIVTAWQPRSSNKMKSKGRLPLVYMVKSLIIAITARLKHWKDGKFRSARKLSAARLHPPRLGS
jgi:hypothetical protein